MSVLDLAKNWEEALAQAHAARLSAPTMLSQVDETQLQTTKSPAYGLVVRSRLRAGDCPDTGGIIATVLDFCGGADTSVYQC